VKIVSVDIETTGLDPQRHEVWEVACIPVDAPSHSFCYQLPATLNGAEATALEVGRFRSRYLEPKAGQAIQRWPSGAITIVSLDEALKRIEQELQDAQLLGCSVHFDANFLAELLARGGRSALWHHRYLDLGSFAAGAWGAKHALSSKAMSDRVPNLDAHRRWDRRRRRPGPPASL
jgi:oligoribonuclease (3'-5' exoribonuclease)